MTRLQEKYHKIAAVKLAEEFGMKNTHRIPKIVKVVVNVGAGKAAGDDKYLDQAFETLQKITGQVPIKTVAKASIAGFKLREGQKIGVMVTLRGARMYEFLDRLVSVVLPRIRDFRGISVDAFDPSGNYSLGLRDHTIFPELAYEDSSVTHSLQVNIVTTAQTKEEGQRLLILLGFPMRSK